MVILSAAIVELIDVVLAVMYKLSALIAPAITNFVELINKLFAVTCPTLSAINITS